MHTIRLRKPWTRVRGDDSARVDVPDPDTAANVPARVTTYSRRFNKPTGLDSDSRLLLNVDSWRGKLTALSINQRPLATGNQPLQIDITDQLDAHNLLSIELVDEQDTLAVLDGEIALVIEEPSDRPKNPA